MKRPSFLRADRSGNLALILILVVILVLLGITFLTRAGGERRLTELLLAMDRSQAVAEAAVAEAYWSVQKSMNTPGTPWYGAFRQPAAGPAVEQTFTPAQAQRLLEELAGTAQPKPGVKVTVRLLGPLAATGPAADPAEKTAYLKAEAAVTIAGVERKLEAIREARVARVAPAPPLDAFTLWIFSGPGAGALRAPADLPGAAPGPLDSAVKQTVERSWTYQWGSQRSRFPFSRDRVSEFHKDWPSFLARRQDAAGVVRLPGVVVVGDTSDFTLQGVKLAGNGALWVPDASLKLVNVPFQAGDHPQIAVLGSGKKLELQGYPPGTSIRASLAVPDGKLVTEPDLTIEGSVFADEWAIPANTTLRHAAPPDPLLVTLSAVTYVP